MAALLLQAVITKIILKERAYQAGLNIIYCLEYYG